MGVQHNHDGGRVLEWHGGWIRQLIAAARVILDTIATTGSSLTFAFPILHGLAGPWSLGGREYVR